MSPYGRLLFSYNGISPSVLSQWAQQGNPAQLLASSLDVSSGTLELAPTAIYGESFSVNTLDVWGNYRSVYNPEHPFQLNQTPPPETLDWMVLDAPNSLQYNALDQNDLSSTSGGSYAWQAWGPSFNGLHMMLGWHNYNVAGLIYQTVAVFADYMQGSGPTLTGLLGGQVNPVPQCVLKAWMLTWEDEANSDVYNGINSFPNGGLGGAGVFVSSLNEVPAAMGPFINVKGARVFDATDFFPNPILGSTGISIPPNTENGWWYTYTKFVNTTFHPAHGGQ